MLSGLKQVKKSTLEIQLEEGRIQVEKWAGWGGSIKVANKTDH